jgi:hypothetical protein
VPVWLRCNIDPLEDTEMSAEKSDDSPRQRAGFLSKARKKWKRRQECENV